MRTGQCLRKYERAHTQGVNSVSFSKDGTHVLSSSYDGLVRVHGIKSGKMLKELRGHTSYVNDAIYSPDGSQVIYDAITVKQKDLVRTSSQVAYGSASMDGFVWEHCTSGTVYRLQTCTYSLILSVKCLACCIFREILMLIHPS